MLLSITKLQNLKAIHNSPSPKSTHALVVINHKTTKFESNSQRTFAKSKRLTGCYQSQNYKIWKQFTTQLYNRHCESALLSITKLQNLKAIHNTNRHRANRLNVVINHKTTKFESNSQLFLCAMQLISQKQRKQRLQRRNEKIRELFSEHTNKYPPVAYRCRNWEGSR